MAKAPTYELIKDFGDGEDISTSPYWVICVIPLALPSTYSRSEGKSVDGVLPGAGIEIRKDPGILIITEDCTSISVSTNKESHIGQMSAVLSNGRNYLLDVLPGDWVMAWMMSYKDTNLLERISGYKKSNQFHDGLKFVGRIQSVRNEVARSINGEIRSEYHITANSFRELETQIFYDPAFIDNQVTREDGILTWMARLNIDFTDFFRIENNYLGNNSHVIVEKFMKIVLGTGVPNSANITGQPTALVGSNSFSAAQGQEEQARSVEGPLTKGETDVPQFAYGVPSTVGKLLGKDRPSNKSNVLSFIDLVECVTGVQSYENTNASDPGALFRPRIQSGSGTSFLYTGTPLQGAFLPVSLQFTNRSVWSLIDQFRNPVINEMFTTLRANQNGDVVPQFIFRQIPFTSPAFKSKDQKTDQQKREDTRSYFQNLVGLGVISQEDFSVLSDTIQNSPSSQIAFTPFLSIPRWKLDPVMISGMSIGRSDVTRCNFVHLTGQNSYQNNAATQTEQLIKTPPILDSLDVQRSGLRPYIAQINVVNQVNYGILPKELVEIVADWIMGNHLTVNGTVTSVGIQAPICVGDNLEFGGIVYHITGVTHSCSISADGMRRFSTSLNLANGMLATDDTGDSDFYPLTLENGKNRAKDLSEYAPFNIDGEEGVKKG